MTSTNDGKDVKSNQTSGQKGKSYYIELYKSLDARLSGECGLDERTAHLCEAWRRVHSLCLHSAPATNDHLLAWLQRHTANTVLHNKWSKEDQDSLEEAIDTFIKETETGCARKDGVSPPWETELLQRAQWFKQWLSNPWGHPVLRLLLDPKGETPSDEQILEWLKRERGIMFSCRLRQLAASRCGDLAALLATAVMSRARVPADEAGDKPKGSTEKPSFADILTSEAGFTLDVWELVTDIEFVLLHKGDSRSKCIELAKQTPLRSCYQLVERLQGRLEASPGEKKLWKNAKEVATLIAQVVIARCMVVPTCTGAVRTALYCCARALVRLLPAAELQAAAAALAAPAATARHLHQLAFATRAQRGAEMTPFVCELYVRAITAGMNELERLKLNREKEAEARQQEQTLAGWFTELGNLLCSSARLRYECALTAFSVHPAPPLYAAITQAPLLPGLAKEQDVKEETTSEFGSWATDSRTQTNLVKTSETLNIKHTAYQANVLSTALLTEGEALGLSPELCQDLAVLLSGPRVKTLSWDMDRELLLENCRTYMERTHGGTRALTTELKYLNLDPRSYQHLPEEDDAENDAYYGIEKGYEHLVEAPEEIWQDALSDPERTESVSSTCSDIFSVKTKKKKKKKLHLSSDEDSDPLSHVAEAKRTEKKKERPHSKERSKERKEKKKAKPKEGAEKKESSRERRKDGSDPKEKKEKKPRKKKLADEVAIPHKPGSLSSLIGLKVANVKIPEGRYKKMIDTMPVPCVTDSDYDSQGKSSLASLNSEGYDPDVLFDGLYNMDDYKSPEKRDPLADTSTYTSGELSVANGRVAINSAPLLKKDDRHNQSSYLNKMESRVSSPNAIREEVKRGISKLIEFRRQKSLLEETQIFKSSTPSPAMSYSDKNASTKSSPIVRPNSDTSAKIKSPSAIIRPEFPEPSVFSPKAVEVPEIPKAYIDKKQIESLKELKQEVDTLLYSQYSNKPVIRYAQKQSAPPGGEASFQQYLQQRQQMFAQNIGTPNKNSVSVIHTSVEDPEKEVQKNFQDFLRELQESINAGTGASKKAKTPKTASAKKQLKPISRVPPVIPNIPKIEPGPSSQCAKPTIQSTKKVDNQLNTFSRLSYMHKNKQSDVKLNKQSTELSNKELEHIISRNIEDHKSAKLKYLQTKGDISVLRVGENAHTMPKDEGKVIVPKVHKPSVAMGHPLLTNMLHSKNAMPNQQLRNEKQIASACQPDIPVSKDTALSQKDQNDLLLLLRQQNKLNTPSTYLNTDVKRNPYPNHTEVSNNAIRDYIQATSVSNSVIRPTEFKGSTVQKYEGCRIRTVNSVTNTKSTDCISQKDSKVIPSSDKKINVTICKVPKVTPSCSQGNINASQTYESLDSLLQSKEMKKPNIMKKERKESKTGQSKKSSVTLTKVPNTAFQIKQHATYAGAANPQDGVQQVEPQDWERVMDALLSHKTPSLGPNALDVALKKDSFAKTALRNQRIVRSKELKVGEQPQAHPTLHSAATPVHTVVNDDQSNVTELSKKKPASKDGKLRMEPQKRPVDVHNPITGEALKGKDPFISGIPNSDYDLLEELMDDELRKEIGELSSDEETYRAPIVPKVINLSSAKKTNLIKQVPHTVTTESRCVSSDSAQNVRESIIQPNTRVMKTYEAPKTNTVPSNIAKTKPHATDNLPKILEAVVIPPSKVKACLAPLMSYKQKSEKKTCNVKQNDSRSANIVDVRNMLISAPIVQNPIVQSKPVAPKVVVLESEVIYDPYAVATVQAPIKPIVPALCHVNQTPYIALNTSPNITVYQTTQSVAPLVDPVIIGSAMTTPTLERVSEAKTLTYQQSQNVSNSQINNQNPIVTAQTCDKKSLENLQFSDNKSDSTTLTKETTDERIVHDIPPRPIENAVVEARSNLDINANKNSERKVLSEVQEKQAKNITDKFDTKGVKNQKSTIESEIKKDFPQDQEDEPAREIKFQKQNVLLNDIKKKVHEEALERIMMKRLAILDRTTLHISTAPAIALEYKPLFSAKKNISNASKTERTIDTEIITKTSTEPSHDPSTESVTNTLWNKEVPKQDISNENSKENDSKSTPIRRILLRSSNDLKTTIVTENHQDQRNLKVGRKTKVRLKPQAKREDSAESQRDDIPQGQKEGDAERTSTDDNKAKDDSKNSSKRTSKRILNKSKSPRKFDKVDEKSSEIIPSQTKKTGKRKVKRVAFIANTDVEKTESPLPNVDLPTKTASEREEKPSVENTSAKNVTSLQNEAEFDVIDIEDALLGSKIPKIRKSNEKAQEELKPKNDLQSEQEDVQPKTYINLPEETIGNETEIQEDRPRPLRARKKPRKFENEITDEIDDHSCDEKPSNNLTISISKNKKGKTLFGIKTKTNSNTQVPVITESADKESVPEENVFESKIKPNSIKLSTVLKNAAFENRVPVIKKNVEKLPCQANDVQITLPADQIESNDNSTQTDKQTKLLKSKGSINLTLKTNKPSDLVLEKTITSSQNMPKKSPEHTSKLPERTTTSGPKNSDYDSFEDLRHNIKIEELPSPPNEPLKKCVRIKLPNGKVFKATVLGKMQVSFETIFADPALKSVLLNNLSNTKRYTLNIKQVTTADTSRIEELNVEPSNVPKPVEVVNLLSDEEEDTIVDKQTFVTEFGQYKSVAMDEKDFQNHQKKLQQKCFVKLIMQSKTTKLQDKMLTCDTNLETNAKILDIAKDTMADIDAEIAALDDELKDFPAVAVGSAVKIASPVVIDDGTKNDHQSTNKPASPIVIDDDDEKDLISQKPNDHTNKDVEDNDLNQKLEVRTDLEPKSPIQVGEDKLTDLSSKINNAHSEIAVDDVNKVADVTTPLNNQEEPSAVLLHQNCDQIQDDLKKPSSIEIESEVSGPIVDEKDNVTVASTDLNLENPNNTITEYEANDPIVDDKDIVTEASTDINSVQYLNTVTEIEASPIVEDIKNISTYLNLEQLSNTQGSLKASVPAVDDTDNLTAESSKLDLVQSSNTVTENKAGCPVVDDTENLTAESSEHDLIKLSNTVTENKEKIPDVDDEVTITASCDNPINKEQNSVSASNIVETKSVSGDQVKDSENSTEKIYEVMTDSISIIETLVVLEGNIENEPTPLNYQIDTNESITIDEVDKSMDNSASLIDQLDKTVVEPNQSNGISSEKIEKCITSNADLPVTLTVHKEYKTSTETFHKDKDVNSPIVPDDVLDTTFNSQEEKDASSQEGKEVNCPMVLEDCTKEGLITKETSIENLITPSTSETDVDSLIENKLEVTPQSNTKIDKDQSFTTCQDVDELIVLDDVDDRDHLTDLINQNDKDTESLIEIDSDPIDSSPTPTLTEVPDVIEIDDSSNDSINALNATVEDAILKNIADILKQPLLDKPKEQIKTPVEEIDHLKKMLLEDLGVNVKKNSVTIDSDDDLIIIGDNEDSLPKPKIVKTKKCFVKLVNCDNLAEKYEKKRIMKQNYVVKLVRCDHLLPQIADDCDELETSDEFIGLENVDTGIAFEMDPKRTRTGSFSLLDELPIDLEKLDSSLENGRSSPVMQVYDTIADLQRQDYAQENSSVFDKTCSDIYELSPSSPVMEVFETIVACQRLDKVRVKNNEEINTCCEWYETKRALASVGKGTFVIQNPVMATEIDDTLSIDLGDLTAQNQYDKLDVHLAVPTLKILTLKLFYSDEILSRLRPYALHSKQHNESPSPKLKRKLRNGEDKETASKAPKVLMKILNDVCTDSSDTYITETHADDDNDKSNNAPKYVETYHQNDLLPLESSPLDVEITNQQMHLSNDANILQKENLLRSPIHQHEKEATSWEEKVSESVVTVEQDSYEAKAEEIINTQDCYIEQCATIIKDSEVTQEPNVEEKIAELAIIENHVQTTEDSETVSKKELVIGGDSEIQETGKVLHTCAYKEIETAHERVVPEIGVNDSLIDITEPEQIQKLTSKLDLGIDTTIKIFEETIALQNITEKTYEVTETVTVSKEIIVPTSHVDVQSCIQMSPEIKEIFKPHPNVTNSESEEKIDQELQSNTTDPEVRHIEALNSSEMQSEVMLSLSPDINSEQNQQNNVYRLKISDESKSSDVVAAVLVEENTQTATPVEKETSHDESVISETQCDVADSVRTCNPETPIVSEASCTEKITSEDDENQLQEPKLSEEKSQIIEDCKTESQQPNEIVKLDDRRALSYSQIDNHVPINSPESCEQISTNNFKTVESESLSKKTDQVSQEEKKAENINNKDHTDAVVLQETKKELVDQEPNYHDTPEIRIVNEISSETSKQNGNLGNDDDVTTDDNNTNITQKFHEEDDKIRIENQDKTSSDVILIIEEVAVDEKSVKSHLNFEYEIEVERQSDDLNSVFPIDTSKPTSCHESCEFSDILESMNIAKEVEINANADSNYCHSIDSTTIAIVHANYLLKKEDEESHDSSTEMNEEESACACYQTLSAQILDHGYAFKISCYKRECKINDSGSSEPSPVKSEKNNSEVVLNGIEYEDPDIGTCYVFPIAESPTDCETDNDIFNERTEEIIQVIQEIDEDGVESVVLKTSEVAIEEPYLELNIPKHTYSRTIRRNRRPLKRKTDMTDIIRYGKRYKKGRHIDYPKFSASAILKAACSKEYKQVFNYCSSLKFSYSQPFHKDFIDVEEILKDWPLQGEYSADFADQIDSKDLLFSDLDIQQYITFDPTELSLAEELASEYNQSDTPSSNATETNFSMGFGEGSDRVIQNLEDVGGDSKVSAATLSDVKQTQPFLLSEDYEDNQEETSEITREKQIQQLRRYINHIQMRDKVRSFFKKTSVELKNDLMKNQKIKPADVRELTSFPFDLYNATDFMELPPADVFVQVVQVGQLPVSAAAQNPVTCDPRVTQVSDASPSQCSVDNSPQDDSQPTIKTEYTELTTADLSNLPMVQEYAQQHQTLPMESQEQHMSISDENIPIETEIKSVVKIELMEETEVKEERREGYDNNESPNMENRYVNNVDYSFETNAPSATPVSESEQDFQVLYNSTEKQNIQETYPTQQQHQPKQQQQNGTPEKTDQIAHAMNAAGITTISETMTNTTRAQALVNILSQKLRQSSVSASQTTTNNFTKTTSISAMSLQQALAQILPPPLNQTSSNENNQQNQNTPQVLHIVQGKNASGSQITLVDNSQQSVINGPNATPVLHIVQNKSATSGANSNGGATQQNNSFGGLSLVDAGLQQGGNQLLHIVNTGNQKNSNATGQLLKRVNLLTNLANVQGSNEQKMVQFVCKSADGKAIQLNAPHQRSMVLRLQPIETPNVQQTTPKPTENQELSPNSNSAKSLGGTDNATNQEIKSRSVYEENYAKFIQNSSTKTTIPEKSTSLPKFNQAFGKPVFQDGSQKQDDMNSNNSHLSVNTNSEGGECQSSDNAINLDHIGQISSPPLLLRKSPAQTPQSQANIVQQIKQSITPMNIQTMHGGVIYTRQIPVNIGGGQTINLITVPSTELVDESGQKQQQPTQNEMEPSIIKIVPQNQSASNNEISSEDGNAQMNVQNETNQNPQPQPVLTQMRIKLPMLSKNPQMVSGARVVRPSFFQIQRNVIGGANQPVYQQLVLTAAPPLGQQTIRLPQTQTSRQIKVPTENQSSAESQMSSSTLEQLREFDMVLEQVKERSSVPPNSNSSSSFSKLHTSSSDTTDGSSASSTSTETTQQVLYSIGNNHQPLNVAYVNRKATVTTPTTSTYVRSPDSSGIVDSPTSSNHVQIPHTVTTESSSHSESSQPKPKVSSKSKSRPKASSNPPSSLKINTVPPKTSAQKPLEDEQTTQRILYILAEYKEQVENSPDKDKPAPRRRSNPPSNPSGSSKRKKSSSGSRRHGRDMSPIHGEDTCRTMGSEDSSCGTSQGDCNESCLESHSPQDSPRKVVRKLTFEPETPPPQTPRPQPQRNVIVADGQTITVARGTAGKPATAVLMPANYILPVSMVKGGQQIAIVTNRGPKLLTVGGGEGGATNALLLQRLIGPAGLKPVLARPGVRHVRLPTAALHNLQAFNLATATTVQPPDSTASPAPAPTPPELVDTRATSSPWTDRDCQDVKPERGSSPEGSEPWNLPSSGDPHDYTYEETVRADNLDRTVLDPIPDRYSPDMEAQRIFDKMFDVESKKSYLGDSPRCAYDIDASDCDDKPYHQVVQKKDGHRQHRLTHVSAAALRHKYAILEHELRLQKSLSEECEDLGVDSPSASELFPEAELLFAASPAHDHTQDQAHHSHTPQPILSQSSIPQPDMDDQIATDQLLSREMPDEQQDLQLGLDVGMVGVGVGVGLPAALDAEEFARAHPNTTFHSEPTDDGEVQPFTIAGLKGRHITSTIFHSNRAPATVLMTAPQTTVISQATPDGSHAVKYDIDNMINSLPSSNGNNINLSSVLVKDEGLTRFDSILNDSRELHLSNTASAIVHSAGNATQVIRRVCYDEDKRDNRFLMDEPDALIAGDDAKMIAEDSSRDATLESMADVDDDRSSPERHAELFWESNSASERSESRRPLDFSSDSEKCCKSPSYDETNSTDSSGVGTHMRLDSVIKDARGIERSGSADGSSADDTHPPLRTYPPKRTYHPLDGEERSLSGKTRAGERSPDSLEVRRRASGRGVVKRGCHCCNGSPAPQRPKKSRQKKPTMDFTN